MKNLVERSLMRVCPFCGNEFRADHANRKFCPPDFENSRTSDCKVRYNNERAREIRQVISAFMYSAKNNLLILNNFFESGQRIVSSDELMESGFKLDAFAGYYIDPNSQNKFPNYFLYTLKNISENEYEICKI